MTKHPTSGPGLLKAISYDVRQEINSKVIGVLRYNNDIREKLLKRSIAAYHLNEGIGYISNLYSIESSNPLSPTRDEDGLLGYTHIKKSDYQELIKKKYNIAEHGNYIDYINKTLGLSVPSIDYLSDLFTPGKFEGERYKEGDEIPSGKNVGDYKDSSFNLGNSPSLGSILTIQSVLNDILQYDSIKYAMEKTRIGTITPNPIASLNGAVVTNINNTEKTDTKLGLITNLLYANTLKNAAHFNSLRRTPYITPSAYASIGNKMATLSLLNADFKIDPDTGRLISTFGDNSITLNYEHLSLEDFQEKEMIDDSRDIASSQNARYRNLSRNVNFSPFEGFNYELTDFSLLKRTPLRVPKISYIWSENGEYIDAKNANGKDIYNSISESKTNTLISKTNKLFNDGAIDTLIGRFHTNTKNSEVDLLQTAVSEFGLSHGRNLLTKEAYEGSSNVVINGYNNPYCRTWTYHHQYDSINKTIRGNSDAFNDDNTWWHFGRRKGSSSRLASNATLSKTGFAKITPTRTNKDIKNCMFSIENLAWKDVIKDKSNSGVKSLTSEQIGPNGGRIMWFPPYDLKFNENVGVNWQPNEFIGRGEKIYTYTNTERTGTLSFALLVDHPSVIDMWKEQNHNADIEGTEQTLLRFFAGCENLVLNKNKKLQREQVESGGGDGEYKENSESMTKEIVYIFFPHNYSGYDAEPGDEVYDVITYLTTDYESKLLPSGTKVYKNLEYEYRVDNDLKGITFKNNKNYKDLKSYTLNTNLNSVRANRDYMDATMTFASLDAGIFQSVITKVTLQGGQCTNEGDAKMSSRRTTFVKKYLENIFHNAQFTIDDGVSIKPKGTDFSDVSGKSCKVARFVKVILEGININNTTQDSNDNRSYVVNNDNSRSTVRTIRQETRRQKRLDKRNERLIEKNNRKAAKQLKKNGLEEEVDKTLLTSVDDNSSSNAVPSKVRTILKYVEKEKPEEITGDQRWEDEAIYFSNLETNDLFTYTRLTEKIRTFLPAFHSITPEGFNARLAFLHQCTRQGNTLSVSDNGAGRPNAGNMAFGRPPICILRLGDFYHTKIIIDSITIDYETQQWDMNPEGIGMQPMFARISLNFKFLGGSDLTAPITRLQNAVSFNYYANQSIYDNRADIGVYHNGQAMIQGKPWMPGLQNK